ncbi:MAG: hypothetical protein JNL90_11620 [Planctomycetes bacterium]|nr:hypothetical protein [Planctomycetota bacterium]
MKGLAPLIAGLVLGVVAGAAVGPLLLGERQSPALAPLAAPRSSSDPSASATSRSSSTDPASAAPATPAPVDATRVDAPATGAAPASVVDAAVEVVRSAPRPARRTGSGRIEGRIARLDGSGVEGVVVRGSLQPGEWGIGASRTGREPPRLEPLEDAVRRAVDSWYEQGSRRVETTTDRDGRYVLSDLASGRWRLEPWLDGFAIEASGALQPEVATDGTLDFVAMPVERLVVDVTLPDGSPPPRAALLVTSRSGTGNSESRQLWTPGCDLRFKPGSYDLRAALGEQPMGPAWPELLTSAPVEVRIAAGTAPAPIRLALRASPGVRGRVTFPPGARRNQGLVKIAPAPASGVPDLVALAQHHANDDVQWLQRDDYVFKDRAPGRYVVGVARSWNERILAHAVVEIADAMVVADLVVPPPDPAASLVVKLLDPDGALLDSAEFQWSVVRRNGGSSSSGAEAELKSNGNFWVAWSLVGDVDLLAPWPDDVTVQLIVNHSRYGRKAVDVAKGTRALQVRYSSPATLLAAIDGFVGSGYEARLSMTLESVGEDAAPSFSNQRSLGADGTQQFGPVESGRYRLTLRVQGDNAWERRVIANREVELAPGENRASIALPTLCDVVIAVPGGAGSISLQGGPGHENFYATLDGEGIAAFKAMPAGDYVAQLHGGDGMQMMQLRLPASGVVRFEPMVVNAMRVLLDHRDGKLAAMGFEDGDLLVGVDGVEFESSQQLQMAVMQVIGKKEAKFTVERGRRRVELAVDPRALMDPSKLGGRFEPASR